MKTVYKNLAFIISLLFTLSIIGLAYYLFIFPERIANQTHVISLMQIPELRPVMEELYIFVGISVFLGFISTLLHLFNRNNSDESNVVYIEKFKEKKNNSRTDKIGKEDSDSVDIELKEIESAIQKENDQKKKAEKLLSMLAKKIEASQAAIYLADKVAGKNIISLFASYAFVLPESQTVSYEFGEGLAGQVAKQQKLINISDIPDGYIKILSGLGASNPAHLILCPIKINDKLYGVVEFASFKKMSSREEYLIKNAMDLLVKGLDKKQPKEKLKE